MEHSLFWRVGRSVGRTIYAVTFDDEGKEAKSRLIGMMDTVPLAREAVDSHNAKLRAILDRNREEG